MTLFLFVTALVIGGKSSVAKNLWQKSVPCEVFHYERGHSYSKYCPKTGPNESRRDGAVCYVDDEFIPV